MEYTVIFKDSGAVYTVSLHYTRTAYKITLYTVYTTQTLTIQLDEINLQRQL